MITDALTELLQTGVQQMIATAVRLNLKALWRSFRLNAPRQAMRLLCIMGIIWRACSKPALALVPRPMCAEPRRWKQR